MSGQARPICQQHCCHGLLSARIRCALIEIAVGGVCDS